MFVTMKRWKFKVRNPNLGILNCIGLMYATKAVLKDLHSFLNHWHVASIYKVCQLCLTTLSQTTWSGFGFSVWCIFCNQEIVCCSKLSMEICCNMRFGIVFFFFWKYREQFSCGCCCRTVLLLPDKKDFHTYFQRQNLCALSAWTL